MRSKMFLILSLMFFMTGFSSRAAFGQGAPAAADLAAALPDAIRPQISALGTRLTSRDKDKTVFRGQLAHDQSPPRPAKVTIQVPQGFARLEGFLPGDTAVVFDGDKHSRRPKEDAAFLETFAMDSVEGLIASLRDGAAARLVAQDTVAGPGRGTKDEPHYVLYEVTAPIRVDGDDVFRQKFYYFDTSTGLLAMTRYRDGSTPVEVRFSNWTMKEGSAYPGQVQRLENGQVRFSFAVTEVAAEPQKDAASFR